MRIIKINTLKNPNTTNINYKANPIIKNIRIKPKNDIFVKTKGLNMMKNFINLRESLSEKLYPLFVKTEKTCWDFYINSTDENMQKYTQAYEEFQNIYKNRNGENGSHHHHHRSHSVRLSLHPEVLRGRHHDRCCEGITTQCI